MIVVEGLINRVGGKSKQKKEIFKRWLDTDLYDTYVEPFLGGGNIAMNAPVVKTMIASDSDTNLINIFNDFKKIKPDEFRNFDFLPATKQKWQELKDNLPNIKNYKKRLYANLYVKAHSYGGKGLSFHNTKNMNYKKLKQNIEKYQNILANYKIVNKDYKYLIKKYDSPKTFFYLDPPYYKVTSNAYETGEINHIELYDLLKNIKGYFLLSYNDVPYIRNLYKDFYITKFKLPQIDLNTGAPRLVSELLISNYK